MKVKHVIIQSIGLFVVVNGVLLTIGALLKGMPLFSLMFLLITLGGAYLAYYPYKYKINYVGLPAPFKEVYYDEKGLYYDIKGKPYIFKWDEIKEYKILDVVEIDTNPRGGLMYLSPIFYLIFILPFRIARFIAWRKIDPVYASTGIRKIGTVQFIKKDGTSIVLNNVLNPYRLIPIFDKYIAESNQKKGYHM